MYSHRLTCLCLMVMELITFSSEDCRYVDEYRNYCYSRSSNGDCVGYHDDWVRTIKCSQLTELNNHLIDGLFIEIFDSHIDEMTAGSFQEFRSVGSLAIYNSNVHNLEPGVFNGVHLLYLNLSHNSIETISKGVFNAMFTLISLDLSRNAINFIDNGSFTGMNKLEKLYLNDNKISYIPILTNCVNLKTLNIFNNEIDKLDFLIQCSTIEALNVSSNKIKYLDNSVFSNLSSLHSLDLSKNAIKFINNDTFIGTKTLSKLYLNDNRISDIPLLVHCPNLTTLEISKNEINNLNVLQGLSNLTILNLSWNPLFNETDMPLDLFRNVRLLESLNLSNTSIKKLSVGSLSGLTNLIKLDLSVNSLTYLPKGIFHDLRNLKYLYINNNQLSHFEYDGYSKLFEIDLNNNIWNCHTLSVLIKNLAEIQIVRGFSYNTTNINGITCYEETKDFQNMPEYNSSNLNGFDKEYLSYLIKSQNDVNKALVELSRSLNQKDQKQYKLGDTFVDFKHFLNESNFYQRNYSESFWKILEKYQNSQSAQIQKDLSQTNYSIDHWRKSNTIQNNIQQYLIDIKNILSTSKTVSQPLIGDPKYIKSTGELKENENNSVVKSITVPLYCMLIMLCATFVLLLSRQFKKIGRIRSNRIETTSLSTLQV